MLIIDEAQADAICAAIDLYSRLASGQYERLADFVLDAPSEEPSQGWANWHRENEIAVRALKALHFPDMPGNCSHSIHSPSVPIKARLAYDVYQVVRKQLAEDRDSGEWNVDKRPFLSTSGHEYVAKIDKAITES